MANPPTKVEYIHYTFPTKPSVALRPELSEPTNATLVGQPTKSTDLEEETDTLGLGPEFDPSSTGSNQVKSASSERVLEWISHNTGRDGGDPGDWKAAAETSARSRRHAQKARPRVDHKRGVADLSSEVAAHRERQKTVTHDVSTDHLELNPTLSERIGRAAAQPEARTAHADQSLHQPIPREFAIRKYVEAAGRPAEPGSWQACPEVPQSDEIMHLPADDGVPRNQIEGAWNSRDEYLEAHYKLLREDAVFPLRSAVHQVREHPTSQEDWFNGSIGIYDQVHVVGLTCDVRGVALRVSFSLSRVGKRVKWDQSKRLISGTLVALTPAKDMFQTKCVMATVAARAMVNLQQNPPELDLYVPRAEELEIDPAVDWVMVEERSAYFEASRHVLTGLQKLSREQFPLQEHLVGVKAKIDMPDYIRDHPNLDMSSAFEATDDAPYENINVVDNWPVKPTTSLDNSQLAALRRILTKKLAIIQGPPGTGKTHVSVVALKVMLANLQPGEPPIIVSCQTNHALDQLLRLVAEFEPHFCRLGGRSKDRGIVKERTLFNLRKATKRPPQSGGVKARAIVNMRATESDIGKLLEPLATGNTLLLQPQFFKSLGLITDAQSQSLEEGDKDWVQHNSSSDSTALPVTQWLDSQFQFVTRQVHPDDCAYEYEDADLESEVLQDIEAEAKIEDDEFTEELRGKFFPVRDSFTGKRQPNLSDAEIAHILKKCQNLYRIPLKQRGSVYAYLQRQVKHVLLNALREQAHQYNILSVERRIGAWEQDLGILREQKLIGVTTTGLSKYRPLIAALNPRVVLVEEAAETIEAPLTVACVPSLEHLILVGDHQQLRPQCSVKEFEGAPFNLNVSLFERMVMNNVEFEIIKRQRRMIPEIRRLLEPIYGIGQIKDHPLVKSDEHRPPIPGMGGINSFFFTHEWPETRDENMSTCNVQEAEMLVAFFDYLVLNGIPAEKITVMTFYNGQRKALGKAFRKHPNFQGRGYNIVTVDSYQGEQNDVILLSLTRSNDNYSIGFLNVVNRICVALSRAKRGFYLFGNAEILCAQSNTWADVVSIMFGIRGEICPAPRKRIGFFLPLRCETHQRTILAEEPDDFRSINGGCRLPCKGSLPCGHLCELRCHSFAHEEVICDKPCMRVAQCGHTCQAQCCERCGCNLCANEEEADPVESISLSLRQIDAKGAAVPQAYSRGARGTASSPRKRGGRASSPSAWRTYASSGVEAHDRKLMANPHRTFHEWDGGSPQDLTSCPSKSSHGPSNHESSVSSKQPVSGVTVTTMAEAFLQPLTSGSALAAEERSKSVNERRPDVLEVLPTPVSGNLIDLD